jgi:putative ABC transport system ATP-binding protein
VLALLRDEAEAGRGVLVATHSPEVARAADRVIELLDGEIA